MSLPRLRSEVSRNCERCEPLDLLFSHARRTGDVIAWTQKVALTLQVLVGALITALGAALRGPSVRCIILILALYLPDIDATVDKYRDHNSRGYVDTCSMVPVAHEGLKRAAKIA